MIQQFESRAHGIEKKARLPLFVLILVVAVYCVAGSIDLPWPKGQMTALVDDHDWKIEGQFFDTPRPTYLEFPAEILGSPALKLWRSWSPEANGTSGHIVTAPFDAHRYLAIPFFGFPGEVKGNVIDCAAHQMATPSPSRTSAPTRNGRPA